MKANGKARLLSLLLTLAMLAGLLPAAGLPALAAEETVDPNNISSVDTGTLGTLGFDTGTGDIEALMEADDPPLGKSPISLYPVKELMLGGGGGTLGVNDLPDVNNEADTSKDFLTGRGLTHDESSSISGAKLSETSMVRSVALDPDDVGRETYVARVYTVSDSPYAGATRLYLQLISLDESEGAGARRVVDTVILGHIRIPVDPLQAGAFLAIAAGDYDGDGEDEIAVYAPGQVTSSDRDLEVYHAGKISYARPRIEIFECSEAGLSCTAVKDTGDITGMNGNGYWDYAQNGVDTSLASSDTNGIGDYISVSLATVRNGTGVGDDLAVASGYARNPGISGIGGGASLAFWCRPTGGAEKGEFVTRSEDLISRWERDYGGKVSGGNGERYQEAMMFPSVTSGDIDGDGLPEVVVAGYRVKQADYYNYGNRWDLDHDRCLITWYEGDGKGNYSRQTPMQWISMKPGDYGGGAGAIELNHAFQDGGGNRDLILSPMPMAVFSERGTGYRDSVFVGGFVLMLPDPEKQDEMTFGTGTEEARPANEVTLAPGPSNFRIRYAAPLRALDTAGSSIGERAVLEVTAGNFNNNAMGREQLIFTYLTKDQQGTKNYSTFVAGLSKTGSGDGGGPNNPPPNSGGDAWKSNISGVAFSWQRVTNKTTSYCITVAAPDVDNDSVIMRYNTTGKAPSYYFSDPEIIAVLQAAPYFSALRDECANPGTSVVNSKGTSVTVDNAVEISSSIGIGTSVEIKGGTPVAQTNVLTIEAMVSALGSMGYSRSDEQTRTVSAGFESSYDDTVALTMTPYVRYYYETYNPDQDVWTDSFQDIPLNPQTSQMTVDAYDEVALASGWPTLRDNALFGARAGRPATYQADVPVAKNDWYGCASGGEHITSFLSAGYTDGGSANKSCAKGYAFSNGVTYGGGVAVELGATIMAVDLGSSAEVTYTGGYSRGNSSEAEYSASVPDLPVGSNTDYGFDWDFGYYMADLDRDGDLDCPVLTYLVRNVRALPEAPEDLNVLETGLDFVKLEWHGSPSDQYYVLGRQLSDGAYFPMATLNASADGYYTYTDGSCEPGKTYTYAVKAYAYSANHLMHSSPWSAPVQAATLREGGASIRTQPEDQAVLAGQEAVFKVAVTLPTGAGAVQYTWQTRSSGGSWDDVTGSTGSTLRVTAAAAMDGRQYRCVIRTLEDILYTRVATLTVHKWGSGTTLTLDRETGKVSEYVKQTDGATVEGRINLKARTGADNSPVYAVMESGGSDHGYYLQDSDNKLWYHPYLKESVNNISGDPAGRGQDYVLQLKGGAPFEIVREQNLSDGPAYCSADILDNYVYLDGKTVTLPNAPTVGKENAVYKLDNTTVYEARLVEDEVRYYQQVGGYFYELVRGADGFTPYPGVTLPTGTNVPDLEILEPKCLDRVLYSYVIYSNVYRAEYAYQGKTGTSEAGKTIYAVYNFRPEPTALTDVDYYYQDGNGYSKLTLGAATYGYHKDNKGDLIPIPNFDPGRLRQMTVKAMVPGGSTTLEPGDQVALTAKVENKGSGGPAPTGHVIFTILNGDDGTYSSISARLTDKGTATAAWTPSKPGNYQISAAYSGDMNLAGSDSEEAAYRAFQTQEPWLEVTGLGPHYLGDPIALSGKLLQYKDGRVVQLDAKVSIYDRDGNKDEITESVVLTPQNDDMGIVVRANLDSNIYEATGFVHGRRRPLTVTAKDQSISTGAADWSAVTTSGADNVELTATDGFAPEHVIRPYQVKLTLENGGDKPTAGSYTIRPYAKDDGPGSNWYYYSTTWVSGTVRVSTRQYPVTFAATPAVGGSLTANAGSLSLATGNAVDEGSAITFTASPGNGYAVGAWTVKINGEVQDFSAYTGRDEITVNATGPVEVGVAFTANEVSVTYAQPRGGTLTARLNDASGAEVASGQKLSVGDKVYFTVEPQAGFAVKQWTVDGKPATVAGQILTTESYTTQALYGPTTVAVELTDNRTFRVSLSAIDADGNPADSWGCVALEDGFSLTGGTAPGGSSFTVKAEAQTGYMIREWRAYRAEGSFEAVQGNVAEYLVASLDADLDLRVVFQPEQQYTITFEAEGSGAVTADSRGTDLTSGAKYDANIPVAFTAVPDPGYEVTGWTVDGALQPGETGLTFTIPALTADTLVKAVFEKMPTLAFSHTGDGTVTAVAGGKALASEDAVPLGTAVTVTLLPNNVYDSRECCQLSSLTVDGSDVYGYAAPAEDADHPDAMTYTFLAGLRHDYTLAAGFSAVPTATLAVTSEHGDVTGSYLRKGWGPIPSDEDLPVGGAVTLTAAPEDGWRHTGWLVDGADASGPGALTLPVDRAETIQVEALYEKLVDGVITYADPPAGGSVSAAFEDGSGDFSSGTGTSEPLIFTVSLERGYTVKHWLLNGLPQVNETGEDFYFTPSGPAHISVALNAPDRIVNFTAENGFITAEIAGGGLLDSGKAVADGSVVTFTPTADRGYAFSGWNTGAVDAPLTVLIQDDLDLTAFFAPAAAYTILFDHVTAERDGTEFTSGGKAAVGDRITFTATPPDQYQAVDQWILDGQAVQAGGDTYELTVAGDHQVGVRFQTSHYLVTFGPASGSEGQGALAAAGPEGAVESGAYAPTGGRITFTATPADGKMVDKWLLNGAEVQTNGSVYEIPALFADASVTASFTDKIEHTVAVTTAGTGKGSVAVTVNGQPADLAEGRLTVLKGERVALTAAPATPGDLFKGWAESGSSLGLQTTLTLGQVTADRDITATFNVRATVRLSVEASNGFVTAKAGYGESLSPVAFTSGAATLNQGVKLVLEAVPAEGYMLNGWELAYLGGQEAPKPGLADAVTIGSLDSGLSVRAIFVPTRVFDLPAGGEGYDVAVASRNPDHPGAANQIRAGGTAAFTVAAQTGWTITGLTVNGTDCMSGAASGAGADALTATWIGGVCTITVSNISKAPILSVQTEAEDRPYTVTFNANGGSVAIPSALTGTDGKLASLPTPTRTDYDFDGWFDAAAGGSQITTDTVFIADTTVYAHWSYTGGGGGGGGEPPAPEQQPTTVDQEQADRLVEDAKQNGGDISIKADTDTVILPASLLSGAGSATKADILITTPVGSIRLPNGALGELASLGGEITVQATLEKGADGSATLTLDISAGNKAVRDVPGGVKVTVPYPGGGANTVAIAADGGILPKSIAQNGRMAVSLNGPSSVRLADNPKAFPDTEGHWGEAYIDFVTSHELFQGTDSGVFDADAPMTRGMLWTVLARMESADTAAAGGAWYAPGMEWAKAAGISDGSNPGDEITREQLAVMLWRTAGSPAPGATLDGYGDAGSASEFAGDALRWAVENGILTGKSGGLLDPTGSATRTEVSAMIMRYIGAAI